MKKEVYNPDKPAWVRSRGNSVVTHQALGGQCKESSCLIGLLKGDINIGVLMIILCPAQCADSPVKSSENFYSSQN